MWFRRTCWESPDVEPLCAIGSSTMARNATAGCCAAGNEGSSDLLTPGLRPDPLSHLHSMCCRAMGVDPKTVRRKRPPDNPEIRLEMNKIAEKRRRFGYPLAGNGLLANRERWRIGIMLERKGMVTNDKKLYRIYREEGERERRRMALHRPRKAPAERRYRVVQQRPAKRVPQRGDIRHPCRRPPNTGALAIRLQQCQAAFIAGKQDTHRSAPGA